MNENEIHLLLDEYQDGVITYDNAAKLADAIQLKDKLAKLIMSELAIRGFVSQALSYSSPETFLKSFWERYHAEKADDDFLKKFESKNANEIQEKLKELKSSDSNRREKAWNINVTDNASSQQRGERLVKPQSYKYVKMAIIGIVAIVAMIFVSSSVFGEKPLGRLNYISTDFQILRNGELQDGYRKKYFYGKDQLTTKRQSTVDLIYQDGAQIFLAEKTHVIIEISEKLSNKILRNALHRVDIDRGSIEFKVSISSGPFIISTPQGKVLIRDADGRITVNSNATFIEINRSEGIFYQKETVNPVTISQGSSFIINSEGQIENRKIMPFNQGESNE